MTCIPRILFILLIFMSQSLLAIEQISICNGQMFGANWSIKHKAFITETLEQAGFGYKFYDVPYARAEKMFERRRCRLLIASEPNNAKRFIKVSQPVGFISLWLLSATAEASGIAVAQLPKLLGADQIIAYPRSVQIKDELEKAFGPNNLMQVYTVEQGLEMLRLGRVDYFVLPEIGSTSLNDYQGDLHSVFFVGEWVRWPIYWWFHSDMQAKLQRVELALDNQCPRPQWRFNFGL